MREDHDRVGGASGDHRDEVHEGALPEAGHALREELPSHLEPVVGQSARDPVCRIVRPGSSRRAVGIAAGELARELDGRRLVEGRRQ